MADCGVQVALEGKLRSREEEVKRVSQLLEDDYAEGKVRRANTQEQHTEYIEMMECERQERIHSVDHWHGSQKSL